MRPYELMRRMLGTAGIEPSPGGVTSRYWRLFVSQRGDAAGGGAASEGYMNIVAGLAGTPGGPNLLSLTGELLPGATSTQSSMYAPEYGANSGWGSRRSPPEGLWHSGYQGAPWWIAVDLGPGNVVSASELYIVPRNYMDSGRRVPYSFQLQVSSNGTIWETVLSITNPGAWALDAEKAWTLS